MKIYSLITALVLAFNLTCIAQSNDSKPAPTNAPGVEFPRIDSQLRGIFRVEAPDAQKVQLDLGSVYDMVKGTDGVWTVTTKPLVPGFHYYYLIIDGYRFSDPSSESFYGIGRMMSGIEVPAPDQDFYTAKEVPHGQIKGCYFFSKVSNSYKRLFVYTPADYEKTNNHYPVLYLRHGMGEDERGWADQGKAGINNTYYESQGTAHEWLTWRRCLYQFAPMLFKHQS